jgi:tRNA(Ile)-lysidine synthase
VIVGHVHHGLRGAQADEDADFVRALAAKLGFACVVSRVAVQDLVESEGLGVEEAARRLRYECFRAWASDLEIDAVVLGHHREDQQETVLLRLARGTGLRGLCGMSPRRRLEGSTRSVQVLRPLLAFEKRELLEYLDAAGQSYRVDATNALPFCSRNRVRSLVLPVLEREVHAGVRASLERLASCARELQADLEALAGRALGESLVSGPALEGAEPVELDLGRLCAWPRSVLRVVLDRVFQHMAPCAAPLSRQRFLRFCRLLDRGREGARVDLGTGVAAETRYGRLHVFRSGASDSAASPPALALDVGGNPVVWGAWSIQVEPFPSTLDAAGDVEEWVDGESVAGGLRVRGRQPGDLFQPLGATGRMKLKEFLRARRIPPFLRDRVPLVVCGECCDQIVWVVGERIDHRVRVRDDSRSLLRLRAWRRPDGSGGTQSV